MAPIAPAGAPIIVSALFGRADQAWFDGLRRAHFPPERNQLDAHLTLFHHLPPSAADELKRRLSEATRGVRAPVARAAGLMSLGRGVAFRIEAPELVRLRAELAEAFAGLLTPQDAGGWRAHVTIQNKVQPNVAKLLLQQLSRDFHPREVEVAGLAAWWYRGGPWELLSRHMFA
ncbi:2'-5' RNA ligase family protein [Sphingomonas sp.]|jgi:2'-5' RNA ligase|uniref:2'-5' RNA ligase family protein n=1 Tax=Sphingomonas sp. TaxID=28214 RepID=UPI002D7ED913|nr:2'-5' RNA ligase family protein [Sphingomonas sp.]HEU0043760.1 2'-5' RNA ligase family protein [Sphingomonas sp.]